MLAHFVLGIHEFNWNQRCKGKKNNLKNCLQVPTPSRQRENWSFHVVERTRTTANCKKKKKKMKNVRAKPAKVLFLIHLSNMQICEVLVAIVVVLA